MSVSREKALEVFQNFSKGVLIDDVRVDFSRDGGLDSSADFNGVAFSGRERLRTGPLGSQTSVARIKTGP